MKLTPTIATLIAAFALSACGGGGGGASTGSPVATTPTAPVTPAQPANPTPPVTPAQPANPASPVDPAQPANPAPPVDPTPPVNPATPVNPAPPVATNPADPYTGQPASGTATTMVSGMVVSDVTVGTTVTAYAVQSDGSNGSVLGVSSVTGADGKFSMQLTSAPAGMVRLVAKDGSFKSEADGSKQTNTTTELVTPFITSDLNFFVITPATNLVSHLVSYKAKGGSGLATAYVNSFGFFLTLTNPNIVLANDARSGINLLKTVPGSADDKLNTYQDLLTGIEWLGVRYDLPSNVVVRVLASHAEKGSPLDGVDGTGAAINVGKWVNGVFDEKQAVTLDEVTALRNADGTIQRNANGQILHDYLEGTLQADMRNVYRAKACNDSTALPALVARYPGDVQLFGDANLKAGTCTFTLKDIADLKAKIATNNRSK